MQVTRANGGAHAVPVHAGVARRARATQSRPVFAVHDLLQQALGKLAELERTLVTNQAESVSAREHLSVLAKTISRVRAKVLRLEQDVAQMRHFAYHDELTGLPNRSLLLDRLNQAIAQRARQNRQAALLLLDLDGFKSVNDRFGHAVGDQLLQQVSERLLASTRNADTISRYGGDEFIVLLPDVEGRNGATEVAQKIHARLTEPFAISGHSIAVTACIGIAVYPLDGTNPEELIERADVAMYRAKDHAKPAATPLQPAPRSTSAGVPREAAIRRRAARQARTG
jgi:diguanylate cyclase (GGDEF)-like protein